MSHAGINQQNDAIFSVCLGLFFLLLALVYVRGFVRSFSIPATIRPWRVASFLLSLVLLWIALASSFSHLDHRFLTAHMVQHLLLMTVAPALFLLGDPFKLVSQGLPRPIEWQLLEFLARHSVFHRLGRFLVNPIFTWLAATLVLMGWHVPSVFSIVFSSAALHGIQQFTFLFAGLLFWWPVIQPWPAARLGPQWPILLYLFLATLPCDILSAYLTFCERVVYTSYLSVARLPEASVLHDQQLAGALMWTCITLIYLIPAAVLTIRLLEHPSAARSPDGPQ